MNLINQYITTRRGNVAVFFAIGLMAIVLVVGLAVDYADTSRVKSDVQDVADAAALAAASDGFQNRSEANQKAAARKLFKELCANKACGEIREPHIQIDDKTVTVTAHGHIKTSFMKLLGKGEFPFAASSTATWGQGGGGYLDVHFLADNSGSMNIADGVTEMNKMFPRFDPFSSGDGCAFACHLPAIDEFGVMSDPSGGTGYDIARANNVYLREDRIRDEISRIGSRILLQGEGRAKVSVHKFTHGTLPVELDMESSMDVKRAAKSIVNVSDGTLLSLALTEFKDEIPASGDGTKDNPRVAAILITDGVDNSPGDMPVLMDPAKCDLLKDKGIELYVMNIVYPTVSEMRNRGNNKVWAVGVFYDDIAPALRACASPGRYFEGDYGRDVTRAFDAMLNDLQGEDQTVPPRLIN